MKKSWLSGLVMSGVLCALIAVFLLTNGCTGCRKLGQTVKTGRQLARTAKQMEKEYKEMEKIKPVDPVNWRELVKFLPDNIPGYEAQEPSGETMSWGQGEETVKWSHAKREYSADGRDISIDIFDSGYHQIFWALGFGWFIQGEFDTSEGYLKSLKIKGEDAKINWRYKDKSGSLIVRVAKRFFVNISGDDLSSERDLSKVADMIDYHGIAGLK